MWETEVDGITTGTVRSDPSTTTFKGHFLGFHERSSGKRLLTPLLDLTVSKGDPPALESFEEVGKEMERFLDGPIACTDGAGGFREAKRVGALPPAVLLATVRHSNKPGGPKQFTKSSRLPKEVASPKLLEVFQDQDRNNPASSSLRRTAGTQAVDGYWGNLQGQLRKGNNLGRGAVDQATEHGLAEAFLLESPGTVAFGSATKEYFEQFKCTKSATPFFA